MWSPSAKAKSLHRGRRPRHNAHNITADDYNSKVLSERGGAGQRVGYTKIGPRASPNRITQNHNRTSRPPPSRHPPHQLYSFVDFIDLAATCWPLASSSIPLATPGPPTS